MASTISFLTVSGEGIGTVADEAFGAIIGEASRGDAGRRKIACRSGARDQIQRATSGLRSGQAKVSGGGSWFEEYTRKELLLVMPSTVP